MHPRVLAERNARAIAEMRVAVNALAKKAGIDPPELGARRGNEDPTVYQLREREAIAAFLGDLAGTRPEPEPVPVEADDEPQLPVPQTVEVEGSAPGEGESEANPLPAPETDEGEAPSTPETVEEAPAPVPETKRKG